MVKKAIFIGGVVLLAMLAGIYLVSYQDSPSSVVITPIPATQQTQDTQDLFESKLANLPADNKAVEEPETGGDVQHWLEARVVAILAGHDPAIARAVVQHEDGITQTYRIGDSAEDIGTVKNIENNQVVIENEGLLYVVETDGLNHVVRSDKTKPNPMANVRVDSDQGIEYLEKMYKEKNYPSGQSEDEIIQFLKLRKGST